MQKDCEKKRIVISYISSNMNYFKIFIPKCVNCGWESYRMVNIQHSLENSVITILNKCGGNAKTI